jgi:3-deoxy-D-manno-octulosonate 8-phosphate phosphatase (KDO 8-P phosphatase)
VLESWCPMPLIDPATTTRLAKIRLLALDVDGTLTDGTIGYDDTGRETKNFSIHDGLGIVLARLVGLETAWITGRTSPLVERRARELGVPFLFQGVRDKTIVLTDIAARNGLSVENIAYMGDDLNDLPALRIVGAALAPANAVSEVLEAAHYISSYSGGLGAVRDVITTILKARGDYDVALSAYFASLAAPASTPIQ